MASGKARFARSSKTRHGANRKLSRSGGKKSAQGNKYFEAGEGLYLNPLRTSPSHQKKINSLLFPGLTRDPGLSDRSKVGGPVAGVLIDAGG